MININHISKTFTGDNKAVDDLTLTIPDGEIIGFIGPMEQVRQQRLR